MIPLRSLWPKTIERKLDQNEIVQILIQMELMSALLKSNLNYCLKFPCEPSKFLVNRLYLFSTKSSETFIQKPIQKELEDKYLNIIFISTVHFTV